MKMKTSDSLRSDLHQAFINDKASIYADFAMLAKMDDENPQTEILTNNLFKKLIADKIIFDIKKFKKAGISWSGLTELFEDFVKEVYKIK